jgi:hypothetical protein
MNTMTLGTSTFLVAVGAIMRYAISAQGDGFDVPMIGGILMIVGIVGAVLSIALFAASSNRRGTALTGARGTVIVEEREVHEVR